MTGQQHSNHSLKSLWMQNFGNIKNP